MANKKIRVVKAEAETRKSDGLCGWVIKNDRKVEPT